MPAIPGKITAPNYGNIPHSHRLPVTHREVVRAFGKLSRTSLITLAQQWLQKKNRDFCKPYLLGDQDKNAEEEDDAPYEPAESYEELQEIYKELLSRKGGRREVMDRILEGDWRTGISMYQLATAEIQHLLDHPQALRWTAKRMAKIPNNRVVKDMEVTNDSEHLPRFQAQTFMTNLAKELSPLMKAHYLITKLKTLPITILRVYIHDSPYSSEASLATDSNSSDGAKAVFFIWPNGSPYIYVSLATHLGQVVGDEGRHLRDVVLQAIPKAFSRPSSRYQLTPTNFTARSLSALLAYRGPGKSNAAAGGWSIFADHSFSQNALDFVATGKLSEAKGTSVDAVAQKAGPGRPKRHIDATETQEVKRRKAVAAGRFGSSGKANDGQGIERFEVRIDDPFPPQSNSTQQQQDATGASAETSRGKRKGRPSLLDRSAEDIQEIEELDNAWVPDVRVTFSGSHVFAGVRELVEQGVVDGEQMPGWMTGEAGVTIGAIKNGRIRSKGAVPGV
ncbi:CHL4 family chromosome segregation protein-like protein [Aaosphaeria arxii CBS 175.79]|uniref:CHL4 family chromosome segregation protein-like protein n=1 Tax=Aaosphaeria arxii CBS 175.79 TaxID=1450172 RepID=A0A6A5XLM9_9PLEO|nr:CHL4 family chromosome segregation protein-like protein [Aaosphaeria arxii CBS 175.79]KAF2013806.1 CHL4 family chromosome segregation protein-like protein [Aaosphaeria arxii CBS 175.79]